MSESYSEDVMQVIDYRDAGFKPLLSFEDWRVAGLNYNTNSDPAAEQYAIERHMGTDEVFVLMDGRAWMLILGSEDEPGECEVTELIPGVIYNVRQFAWHGTLMAEGCRILLVEKKDTGGPGDTLRRRLTPEETDKVRAKVH